MIRIKYTRKALAALSMLAVICVVSALCARPAHAGELDQRKFGYEFARFVQDRLNSETEIRAKVTEYIKKNSDKFADGLGMHPELVPGLMEAAGLERMNCVSGRYFQMFQVELDKDGLTFFYGVKEELDHWVTMIALEEAARNSIYNPSPPLTYRRRVDYPPFIALAIRDEIQPYLKGGPGNGKGLGFDELSCE